MGKEFWKSACPHDCPSACSLEVERLSSTRIGRMRGAAANTYTDGVVCAKVARYAERVHHPDRLKQPLQRVGEKGKGEFRPISWDDALNEVAEAFTRATRTHGPEAVWPYHSGGTMGVVQRWGLDRLRHAFGYSRQKTTICVTPAESGWRAGVGKLLGPDPREMAESDLIVVWGGNPVSTQVNAMTHIAKARKQRGAKLAVVDVYRTPTVEAADIGLVLRPGTDGALALAMMHVLLKEGFADRAYLARYTDFGPDIEAHLADKTPEWASAITGLAADEITAFARLYGGTERSFLRVGFGFTRSRNGSAGMHAVTCLPAITGAWQHRGGGAFFLNLDNWKLDTTLAHGLDLIDPKTRIIDQSRIGPILCGDKDALAGGPPVMAMLMQNANSANVAPDSAAVARGLGREDLFTCVHEQFMTATAKYADILLPAAMFLEYDDIYYGLGPHPSHGRSGRARPLRGLPHQPRAGLRAGAAARHQPRELRHERRRASGRDAARLGPRHLGRGGGARLGRLRRRLRGLAFRRRLPVERRALPFQARLEGGRPLPCRHEAAARPSRELRAGERGAAVPPGRAAGARLPEHHLHRDAGLGEARGRAARADP